MLKKLMFIKGPSWWRCLPDRNNERRQEFDLQPFARVGPLLGQGRRQGREGSHLAGARNNPQPSQVSYHETR